MRNRRLRRANSVSLRQPSSGWPRCLVARAAPSPGLVGLIEPDRPAPRRPVRVAARLPGPGRSPGNVCLAAGRSDVVERVGEDADRARAVDVVGRAGRRRSSASFEMMGAQACGDTAPRPPAPGLTFPACGAHIHHVLHDGPTTASSARRDHAWPRRVRRITLSIAGVRTKRRRRVCVRMSTTAVAA